MSKIVAYLRQEGEPMGSDRGDMVEFVGANEVLEVQLREGVWDDLLCPHTIKVTVEVE